MEYKHEKYLRNPGLIIPALGHMGFFKGINDEKYLKTLYRIKMGKRLDINNPITFNEKLQWLKLYDRNPAYIGWVDKIEAKKKASQVLGSNHIIPTIGVWNHFDEIDFSDLPQQFVLKCSHNSGGVIVVKNKNELDIKHSKKVIEKCLRNNFFWTYREWPYKDIKPRIIAEKYMTDDEETDEFTDYKFYCFHGRADCVLTCFDRGTGDTKFYFFDKEWNLKRYNKRGKDAPDNFRIPKPACIDEMFDIAEKLSKNIPAVRVDLYQSKGKPYFGEMTFYPASGFDANRLPEADVYFGSLIDLSKAYNYEAWRDSK